MSEIKTVGVCGAGVMGSQLAALFRGRRARRLPLRPQPGAGRARARGGAQGQAGGVLPQALRQEASSPSNYDDHLDRLGECDWVIEAIAERLDWKQDLYEKISPHLKDGRAADLEHLRAVAGRAGRGARRRDLRRRFLITHFFNPPRYMRLVEIVPVGRDRREALARADASLIGTTLGKGIVHAKDTPNFIANRIGIYGMMLALKLTREMRLTVEQVDALTGPVMGRPKSATFRTADIVGLDTLAFVAKTAYDKCEADEARDDLRDRHPVLAELLERKSLGQKTGAGFYKKDGKEILALDFETLEYRPRTKPRMDGIGVARRYTDLGKRLRGAGLQPGPGRQVRLGADHRHAVLRRTAPGRDRRRRRQHRPRHALGLRLGDGPVRDLGRHRRRASRFAAWSARASRCRSWCERCSRAVSQRFYDRNGSPAASSSTSASEAMLPVPTAPGRRRPSRTARRRRRDPAQLERFAGRPRRRRRLRRVPLGAAAGLQPDRRRASSTCSRARSTTADEAAASRASSSPTKAPTSAPAPTWR